MNYGFWETISLYDATDNAPETCKLCKDSKFLHIVTADSLVRKQIS